MQYKAQAGGEGLHTIIATYKTALGTSFAEVTQKGMINCPSAAPKGLARLGRAVAATRPRLVNHKSEYLVGAANTKGCEKAMRICPNMTTPKLGGEARLPPYRIQLPIRVSTEEVTMDGLGPQWRT